MQSVGVPGILGLDGETGINKDDSGQVIRRLLQELGNGSDCDEDNDGGNCD